MDVGVFVELEPVGVADTHVGTHANRLLFEWPLHGPFQCLALHMTHRGPMCIGKMNRRVLWRSPLEEVLFLYQLAAHEINLGN